MRIRLRTLLALVFVTALALAAYKWFMYAPPWDASGGMIGWSESAIESRLGAPFEIFEYDIPDPPAKFGPPNPPGTYRTLVFRGSDGHFVARMKASTQGYVCFISAWVEKETYY
jgi:hypothetical protein